MRRTALLGVLAVAAMISLAGWKSADASLFHKLQACAPACAPACEKPACEPACEPVCRPSLC
ncbi:MAG: hypothetical protein ACUVQQ_05625, partial [Thermogutta sp.]